MVDIGWAGNLHAALAAAQAAEGVPQAHGYYFGFNGKQLAAWRDARSASSMISRPGPAAAQAAASGRSWSRSTSRSSAPPTTAR